MKLSRSRIDNARFTLIRQKYYPAEEVDRFLHELAGAADEDRQEMERMRAQMDDMQRVLDETGAAEAAETLQKASQRARDMLRQALKESDEVLLESNSRESRALAASRNAYYNALRFKQEIAERYRQLEEDMDHSIDVLREIEGVRRSPLPEGESIPILGEAAEPAESPADPE